MAQSKGPSGAGGEQAVLFAAAVAAAVFGVWIPLRLADPPGYDGSGPLGATLAVATGKVSWTGRCTLALVAELLVLALLVAGGLLLWRRLRGTTIPSWPPFRPPTSAWRRNCSTEGTRDDLLPR